MKIGKHLIGHIVSIRLWDHCIGPNSEPMECEVVGRVKNVTERRVVLEHWMVLNEDDETSNANNESMAIVQSTIISFIEFAAKKAKRFY